MKRLHRWGRPESCGALEVRRGGSVRMLAGELARCLDCGLLRKQTHGGRNLTYSRDDGATWGAVGGPTPHCEGMGR